ncbi:hypothetical protein FISHEDRAFT_55820 [Fistulina hepatica ATCC 64428]|uniref:Thioredoxin-like fold domain-containing protein n=1 Tax=Fistulina hepatica ATCC 64428 TaxID=1128425 RepID=A0A0D7APB9_9AGAR|nr:hypothetical protein FISHEDRAFT_55820 [Fistulina hepatica ATCC 64428]
MALQPTLRPLLVSGVAQAPHTLDIFLDYVCPFSAKMALSIENVLMPLFGPGGLYEGKVKIIVRPQVQPWHASSTLVHEAALAVVRAAPQQYWHYSLKLFEHQKQFFDIPSATKTPLQIREELVELAKGIVPANSIGEVKGLLELKSTPNGGTSVTDDLKYTVKFSRQNGIHVSPTVLWDGIVANEISSGWSEQQWKDFLAAKVVV